mgnify:CR=1 FL=1
MPPTSASTGTSSRPNLRYHHRIAVDLELRLEANGDTLPACRICDLSRTGIMVPCSRAMLDRIAPNQATVSPHQAIPVSAQLQIPVKDNGSAWVGCVCDVITVRRIARDTFHVGMTFRSFEEDGEALVDAYINDQIAAGA